MRHRRFLPVVREGRLVCRTCGQPPDPGRVWRTWSDGKWRPVDADGEPDYRREAWEHTGRRAVA